MRYILQILSRPVQGQGKQDPVPGLRSSSSAVRMVLPLPVRQGVGKDAGQAGVRLRPVRVWMDENEGHEIAFFKS